MIVRAQIAIDHRRPRIVAHPARAAHHRGIGDRPLRRHARRAERLSSARRRAPCRLSCPRSRSGPNLKLMRGRGSPSGSRWSSASVTRLSGFGKHLDRWTDRQLARDVVAHRLAERGAAQALRGERLRRLHRADRARPALVRRRHRARAELAAKRSVAQFADAGRRHRPSIRIDRIAREADHAGVELRQQIAADLVARVRDARAQRRVRDISRSFGDSIVCAATTNTLPRASCTLPSGRMKRTAATRPSMPTSIAMRDRERLDARARGLGLRDMDAASYLAPIGQIGTHDALPQHGGRPSRPIVLRAWGNGAIVKPICAQPRATT